MVMCYTGTSSGRVTALNKTERMEAVFPRTHPGEGKYPGWCAGRNTQTRRDHRRKMYTV